jgi:DMSO/TMAO reductase YedYZ molybdopterin-dependent catalytic subunit
MGLIIRQKEPTNLETPFDQVDSFFTPTELFYIRSHFPAPKLDLASYQLRIDGAVRNPFSLSYKELRDIPLRRGWPLWSAQEMVASFRSGSRPVSFGGVILN